MLTTILVLLGIIVAVLGSALLFTEGERREARNLPIAAINFKQLQDGVYVGEYAGGKYRWRATKVQTTVSDGEVTDIELLKGALDKTGQPAELNQSLSIKDLFNRVVDSQSLQVDVISGATLTSKAHLKAVENALLQAQGN